ncbi:hypothetical protein K6U06_01835 [Acidiferrimicrobium sp. IK]|nr:hypothetical protein [Acidiferrimicrobium sp. IK]MCU4183084.1 hypothetical protein [Acidiferrimicrobium sp. IK]
MGEARPAGSGPDRPEEPGTGDDSPPDEQPDRESEQSFPASDPPANY